nr:MAG TPA: hypothetical protein [Caudoviricetes sp.]
MGGVPCWFSLCRMPRCDSSCLHYSMQRGQLIFVMCWFCGN